jgi:cytochrome c oxidase subunit 1
MNAALKLPVEPWARRLVLLEIVLPVVLLVLGIYAGLLQVLFRAGVIQAAEFWGWEYYQALTLHGVVNAIVFTTFFAVAFGNALVPYALGMKLPLRWAWVSGIVMIVGTLMAAWAILAGKASVLYTFYPPLMAHPLFYIGAALFIIGSWIAFFNWIPLYLRWRREHPGEKTPLAVVGMFATFIVWLIATVAVAIEVVVLLIPWSLGWTQEVNVPLARMLFWFFGHPLVYFWLLPAYTMYYTMLPRLGGGKLYSDKVGRMVFMMFILFSIPVGAHHQFAEPAVSSGAKLLHSFLTFAVALPSLLTAFTLAASLEHGARQRGAHGLFDWIVKQPFFSTDGWMFSYLIAGLVIFIMGGISGIINASYSMNLLVHNTSWLPGHFHLTVAGPVLLAFLGMSLHLLATYTGKAIRLKRLAVAVPYLWLVGVFIFSWGMMRGGLHGEPRRTNLGMSYLDPDSPFYNPEWKLYVTVAMIGGIIMTLAMIAYFTVFFATALRSRTQQPAAEFPLSEAYHDEPVGALANLRPWVITAIVLIVIAYTPMVRDVMRGTFSNAPGYEPHNPAPVNQIEQLDTSP